MAKLCVEVFEDRSGVSLGWLLIPTVPQPPELALCQFVVVSPDEVTSGGSSQLTPEDVALLTSGVLLVWSIAWVFRQVMNQIRNRN